MMRTPRAPYYVFALVAAVYFLNLGNNAIWTTHEAYYAEVVREMLASGNWLEFYFNYEPRFQKPPVTYWLMATSASIFGLSEFSLRLPIVLCSLLTLVGVYQIGKLLANPTTGLVSMMVLAVSLQFAWIKHFATPEIPLTLFFTLSVYFFIRARPTKNPWFFALGFVSIGLAALTKGTPFILLYFLLILAHRWINDDQPVRWGTIALGFAGSMLIGSSWSIYMMTQQGTAYTNTLWFETVGRPMGVAGGHLLEGLYFYPLALSWGLLPFSVVLILALSRPASLLRSSQTAIPLIWLVIFLVLFSLSVFKLPVYLLPSFPAAALLIGHCITQSGQARYMKLSMLIPSFGVSIAYLLIVIQFELNLFFLLPLVISVVVSLWLYKRKTDNAAFLSTWLTALAFLVLINLGLMPWLEQFRPYRHIATVIDSRGIGKEVPLHIDNRFLDNLPYYARRKVIKTSSDQIEDLHGEKLLLARAGVFQGPEILWQGHLQAKGAEDHYFKFIRDCYLFRRGDAARFVDYQLLYWPPPNQ